jgi:hypothetical protein
MVDGIPGDIQKAIFRHEVAAKVTITDKIITIAAASCQSGSK